jgi:hypothetical protein
MVNHECEYGVESDTCKKGMHLISFLETHESEDGTDENQNDDH